MGETAAKSGISTAFRDRVLAGEFLVGTFVKTPAPHIVEIAGLAGLDFVVLDAEHAPFDRAALDMALLASHAANIPAMVRIPRYDSEMTGACLDLGASGIIVPHVSDASIAKHAVSLARFSGGSRGLSPSTRAGSFGGMSFTEYAESSDRAITVWAQIEDQEGLHNVQSIAHLSGIDALFIGRVDLAYACDKASINDPEIQSATSMICEAAKREGKTAALFESSLSQQSSAWAGKGVSLFVIGSDQSYLLQGFKAVQKKFENQLAGVDVD
jgi:2-keto-3-deoxy-L-rhamnonate aldolase RhmA